MKTIKSVFVFLVCLVFTGCASQNALIQKEEVDFSKYKTYAWQGINKRDNGDVINFYYDKERLKSEIDRRLSAKGFEEVAPKFDGALSGPDLYVVDRALIAQFTNTENHYQEKAIRREGSLILSFVDAKTDKVVWQTRSIGVLYEPDNRKDELAQTVREVLVSLDQFLPER